MARSSKILVSRLQIGESDAWGASNWLPALTALQGVGARVFWGGSQYKRLECLGLGKWARLYGLRGRGEEGPLSELFSSVTALETQSPRQRAVVGRDSDA